MSQTNVSDAAVSNERVFAADPRAIFAAFAQPEKLAQWWGPSGFTSTFERFEFVPGGHWVFTMHGPNGADYANESIFRAIEPDRRIVIEHIMAPHYTLTVTLTPRGDGTHVSWVQEFDSPEHASRLRSVVHPGIAENLDGLQALLAAEGE